MKAPSKSEIVALYRAYVHQLDCLRKNTQDKDISSALDAAFSNAAAEIEELEEFSEASIFYLMDLQINDGKTLRQSITEIKRFMKKYATPDKLEEEAEWQS